MYQVGESWIRTGSRNDQGGTNIKGCLSEENIHPQCAGCNGFGMKFHNKEAVYTLFMEDKYGREFVDELIYKSKQAHKWNRCEVEDLIAEFKKEIKFHEDRVA